MGEARRIVRLIQLLCPARHCIIAIAYESESGEPDQMKSLALGAVFGRLVDNGAIKPSCGICGSRSLRREDAATKYTTMDEANAHIQRLAKEQAETAEFFRRSRN